MANRTLDQDLHVGIELGHYRIVEKIGAGGMGEVYRARDQHLARDVAIKVLPLGTLTDESARKHFHKEALILSQLNHPNIATIHDFDTQQGVDFLVMEYIPGMTLNEKVAGRPLPEKEVLRLGVQLAEGLAAAHDHGVVHRDVKPGNLRVTSDGRLKILDFGLAKLWHPVTASAATENFSKTQAVAGTLLYMAPEQLLGGEIDARTDLHAAGFVLYELATGQHPFADAERSQLVGAILFRPPPPPTNLNPRLSPELGWIIGKCLEKEPEDRYQSAKELAIDLRRLLTPIAAAEQVGLSKLKRPKRDTEATRRMPKWGAGLAAIAVVLLIPTFYWFRARNAPVKPSPVNAPIASLAILPLVNATKDPNLDYVTDGITDSLINQLAQLPTVRITARPTAFLYKEKRIDPGRVGKELSVAALTTGRVGVEGNEVVVVADLIDTTTGAELWGNTYRRERNNIATLSNDIASAIAEELRLKLTVAQKARLTRAPTMNALAYDLYLKGMHALDEKTAQGTAAAIKFFQDAVQADPDYARAWAMLAASYMRFGMLGEERLMYGKAREAVKQALRIDPNLAEAHMSAGLLTLWDEWNFGGAEREYRLAIRLNPNLAAAHENYCALLRWQGKFDAALREGRAALQLDPLSKDTRVSVASTLMFAGRYDDALRELKALQEIAPQHPAAPYLIGRTYELQGRSAKACAEFVKSEELSHEEPPLLAALTESCHSSGLQGYYKVERDALIERDPEHNAILIGDFYLATGEKNKAYQFLEKAFANHDTGMLLLYSDPGYKVIRNEPRFVNLLKRVGFDIEASPEALSTNQE